MSIRSVQTTDTLETFRTTFNSLASSDIGDVATLNTTSKTVVGAINEIQNFDVSSVVTLTGIQTLTNKTINGPDNTLTNIANSSLTNSSVTIGSSSVSLGNTLSSISGLTDISGTGTANFTTDVQVNSVSVATRPFAIAQAIALG
jgi:hypothetical protein